MLKRGQEPLKGEWWPPGGRVLIGERLIDAALRKLSEEINIAAPSGLKMLGVYEDFFDRSAFSNNKYHTVSVVFSLNILTVSNLKVDKTSDGWVFVDQLPDRLARKLVNLK
jgi:ADP-ribose pyrophosphatase YjhB (NUDIX family)